MTRLLDADADEPEWLALWQRTGREPFAHPAYGRLFAAPGDRAALVVVGSDAAPSLVPLILRGRGNLPWLADEDDRVLDATSPYGYGGPYPATGDLAGVLRALQGWATEAALATVFLRLSLDVDVSADLDAADAGTVQVVDTADNVVVRLDRSADDIWAGHEHKVRKNVKKAVRAGCTVERDDNLRLLDDFVAIYGSTMQRRRAAAWYRFDREFFARLGVELAASYSIFAVRDPDGAVVSVELVLESDRYLYSFLGGTLAEAFPLAANDLLKHAVIEHGRTTGRQGFVLGGGASPGDGIFRYKRAFDPAGVRVFRTARLITDPVRYERWSRRRAALGHPAGTPGQFFPAYRLPPTG